MSRSEPASVAGAAVTAAAAAEARVRAQLSGPAQGLALLVVPETGSTNSDLMQPDCQAATPLCARWALRQTGGRGRNGRSWLSDEGSLTFSLRRPLAQSGTSLLGLPLAVAVAVCQGLEDLGIGGLSIKWPNDLLRHGRKAGGILVEVGMGAAVIGIGLNVQIDAALAKGLDQPVADLQSAGQPRLPRELVLATVLNRLVPALELFDASGFAAFQSAWTARAAWLGQAVQLGTTFSGVLLGVDGQGALRLQTPTGEQRGLVGDLSLRRIGDDAPAAQLPTPLDDTA